MKRDSSATPSGRPRKPRKHYKCVACKTFYRKPSTAENHIVRDHGGIGIVVFDPKGSSK